MPAFPINQRRTLLKKIVILSIGFSIIYKRNVCCFEKRINFLIQVLREIFLKCHTIPLSGPASCKGMLLLCGRQLHPVNGIRCCSFIFAFIVIGLLIDLGAADV